MKDSIAKFDSLPLDIRQWTCDSCTTSHDREMKVCELFSLERGIKPIVQM